MPIWIASSTVPAGRSSLAVNAWCGGLLCGDSGEAQSFTWFAHASVVTVMDESRGSAASSTIANSGTA
eukprot:306352-Prymnesium_polylepis.2